jgi:hypothetical protein
LALKDNGMPMPYAQNLRARMVSARLRAPLSILKGIDLPVQPLTDGEEGPADGCFAPPLGDQESGRITLVNRTSERA